MFCQISTWHGFSSHYLWLRISAGFSDHAHVAYNAHRLQFELALSGPGLYLATEHGKKPTQWSHAELLALVGGYANVWFYFGIVSAWWSMISCAFWEYSL